MKAGKAMAGSTANDRRPEFPDRDRPLYTPDEEAQRQVVARIAQARKGKRARKGKESETSGGADYRIEVTRPLPMGQHPYVSSGALACELGGMSPKTADRLVGEHPEDMDPWQVRQLCKLCGVTLEWLRGWEDVNAFGMYESAEDVAAMYAYLSNEDRALVCDLLTRLLGADATEAVKAERWAREHHEWLGHHTKEAGEFHAAIQAIIDSHTQRMQETIQSVQRTALKLLEPVRDAAQPLKDYYTKLYTADEWELMERTAKALESQGVDASRMTPDELLAYARGDSVEDC